MSEQSKAEPLASSLLFPEPVAARTGPLRAGAEPLVNWFLKFTRPEASASRRNVNSWYMRFPDSDGRMGARLRNVIDVDHQQALDELFIHELLQGYGEVRYEEPGFGRAADFRLYRDGALALVVEVRSLFQKRQWSIEEESHAKLAAQLEPRLHNRNFLLHLEARLERQPSVTALAAGIDRFLDELDPGSVPFRSLGVGQDLPRMGYREQGVSIVVEAVPIRPGLMTKRTPDDRIIVSGPSVGGLVDSGRRLKRSLSKKRAAVYAIPPGVPYLIAAGIHDTFCSVEQVQLALYGPDLLATRRWDSLNEALGPSRQGLFGIRLKDHQPQNTRVSAVAALWLETWSPEEHRLLLFENPAAQVRVPTNVFPFTLRLAANGNADWSWHGREGST